MRGAKIIPLILCVALGFAGVGYAAWTEKLTVKGTAKMGELDWCYKDNVTQLDTGYDYIAEPGVTDSNDFEFRQTDRNVGSTKVLLQDTDGDGDKDNMVVTVSNVYPGYYNNIQFQVKNNGTVPLVFRAADVNTPPELDVRWVDTSRYPQKAGDINSFSFHFRVNDSVKEQATYKFNIDIKATQWNEAKF
ncbi:hypothetical protein GJ688_13555 [Heliobacillus mobilis]|uniref:SipW-cognate class signal peptide n=1 Tax=Heliobacterium mobile TaxID=28064 RepID=A0A6I3SM16_HELMO|nr:hypothetical protein [Heliobacterium mobile]MTV50001.1 hypothetical protein [Heliobacterium mobile]